MLKTIWNVMKVLIVFIACTFLFYYGLRLLHAEMEYYQRYDQPQGPVIKVYNSEENSMIDRIHLFLRLGE